jgi:glycosyltransferase involved in cell wall biosynthesis
MGTTKGKIRIIIEIDVTPGLSGGIAQSTQGLVSSLGQLEGPEEYILATETPAQTDWITQYRGSNQQVVMRDPQWRHREPVCLRGKNGIQRVTARFKAGLKPVAEKFRHQMGRLVPQRKWPVLPLSDGYYESLGCDVLHYPTQGFKFCALPTIYNPHDLQHLHYPNFWPVGELAWREVIYRSACQLSNTVVVGSEWIKQDVIRQFSLSPDKIQIIPWASPTAQYPQLKPEQMAEIRTRLALPEIYMLYPAVTWPHKNHVRLLEAIAELRDQRGLIVNLVCTGARFQSHWPKIEQRIKELRLESQVKFLGFLSETDLRAVYRQAQFLVLPTLFEADSCPIHEAWSEGIPVASSNHTALPDQVGEAGLLFDAKDVSAIADAIQQMTTDAALRQEMIGRGYRRVKDFDWTRTAKAYRAVYRRAANITLSEEDRWLLQWDWMREPGKLPPVKTT